MSVRRLSRLALAVFLGTIMIYTGENVAANETGHIQISHHSRTLGTENSQAQPESNVENQVDPLAGLLSRIKNDLSPWRISGITREMVEHTYCTDHPRNFRLQIVDGQMYVVGEVPGFYEFNRMTKIFILDTASTFKLPDVDIVITTADNCPMHVMPIFENTTKCPYPAPLFANSRYEDQTHCVLYPTFSLGSGGWPMPNIPSWQSYLNLMKMERNHFRSFEDREDKLYFHGAPTGNRGVLLANAQNNNTKTAIRLTGWTEDRRDDEHISLPQHCDYRYLLHLPGHGYSVRLKYLLLCASTVVFYDNGMHEFWYHILEDRKHVFKVPAGDPTMDFDNMYKAVLELEGNPEQAKYIAEEGRKFVEDILTVQNVQRYFAELLWEYASMQKFKPQVHSNAVPFRISVMGPDAKYTAHTRDCSYCIPDVEAQNYV